MADNKKKNLFDLYSGNLHMLSKNGLLPGLTLMYENTYICPLCKRQFNESDLDSSKPIHLTLEHVPPASVGGKHYLLTCNLCNNQAGDEIDNHLAAQLKRIENNKFLPDTEFYVHVHGEAGRIQGIISIASNRKMSLILDKKSNDPKKILEFNNALDKSHTARNITVSTRLRRPIIFDRIPIALLKTAYLLAFEQFGYLFLLGNTYEVIRQQISKPNYLLYPHKFWAVDQFDDKYEGTHIVRDAGLQSIMSVFPIKTKKLRLMMSTIIPLPAPFNSIGNVLENLKTGLSYSQNIKLSMHKPVSTYLNDLEPNAELDKEFKKVSQYYFGFKQND